ncbi:MAG TPA: hypothetical protein PKZ44_01155 [Flavobacterium sp.]|nr:hypothetical protein [Flavobacterium sp.]
MRKFYFVKMLLFFYSFFIHAQDIAEKVINGTIICDSSSVEGVHVLNLVNEKSTVTDRNGHFSIVAKQGDLLVFSAVHLNYWRKSVKENDFKTGFLEVIMTPKEVKLNEVVLTEYTKINAQELGIINYKPKAYTPAERKLRPTKITQMDLIGLMAFRLPLDPLLYWATGRTKMLKNDLKIEKKELLLRKLNDWNDNEFYANQLKIPKEFVDGFKYYIIYDDELMSYLQSNNKIQGNFRISKLATDFLIYMEEYE